MTPRRPAARLSKGDGASKARRRAIYALVLAFLLGDPVGIRAYSVLTHEAIIDAAFYAGIKPLLLQRFPLSTPLQLKEAHSYAYGGCVIQDMGYYPFGSKFFSDLVHYVRAGDFVEALLRDARNVDEYAFALGALSHYVADNIGHSVAVNRAVAMTYPKLERKYGHVVTYEENPSDHLKTEFGFDVLEVARGRYAPDSYRSLIGFRVSNALLARAFQQTYGIPLKSVFTNYDLAVGTYRYSISSVIPSMTKAAWQLKKQDIQKAEPGITRRRFLFHISQSSYRKYWHEPYRRPGLGSRIIAFLIHLMPQVWIFRSFAFKMPTPATEKIFMASFNDSLTQYEKVLHDIKLTGAVALADDNLDTGTITAPGQYFLADKTYAVLLDKLFENHFAGVTPRLRKVILREFRGVNAAAATRRHRKDWSKVVRQAAALQAFTPPVAPALLAPATLAPARPEPRSTPKPRRHRRPDTQTSKYRAHNFADGARGGN